MHFPEDAGIEAELELDIRYSWLFLSGFVAQYYFFLWSIVGVGSQSSSTTFSSNFSVDF